MDIVRPPKGMHAENDLEPSLPPEASRARRKLALVCSLRRRLDANESELQPDYRPVLAYAR